MKKSILDLNPETYQRHLIHGPDRIWAETNCYSDLWVELLHAMRHEPIAALPFTLSIDFEGDQWTFFKFPIADLYELYGLDVLELTIWKSLIEHVDEQVGLGRPVLVEMDSYYLPDTHGTAYQLSHTKTTIALTENDVEARHLAYFHAQGYTISTATTLSISSASMTRMKPTFRRMWSSSRIGAVPKTAATSSKVPSTCCAAS